MKKINLFASSVINKLFVVGRYIGSSYITSLDDDFPIGVYVIDKSSGVENIPMTSGQGFLLNFNIRAINQSSVQIVFDTIGGLYYRTKWYSNPFGSWRYLKGTDI